MSKNFYPTLAEAQQAAQALAITSVDMYRDRYRENRRLPAEPSKTYICEWKNWPAFLGKEVKTHYKTLTEAQKAAQVLGIAKWSEYKLRYREDPHLPSCPHKIYKQDWQGWPTFLGKEARNFYSTLLEAMQAIQILGISSQPEYVRHYREDPRLPSCPHIAYKQDWQNWPTFLGKDVKNFYLTLADAKQATKKLCISTMTEYTLRYSEDPRLPSCPNKTYEQDWQGWPSFLGKKVNDFYLTYAEAQKAAQILGIHTRSEYNKRYHEDPRLPSCPNNIYKQDWENLSAFLGKKAKNPYPTIEEAKKATLMLGISKSVEYCQRYHEDPRLPSNPKITYQHVVVK